MDNDQNSRPSQQPRGRDIGPDEDRNQLPSQTNQQIPRPVQMVSGYRINAQGEMVIDYETVYVNNRHGTFFEPLDQTPSSVPVYDQAPQQQRTSTRGAESQKWHDEKKRLESFQGRWDSSYHVEPADLARNGLYYVGPRDKVRCAFCHYTLHNWEPGDDVEQEHRKHYPRCPFVNGQCGHQNIPLNSTENLQKSFGVTSKMAEAPHVPKMQDFSVRLQTYEKKWSVHSPSPDALARAGFYCLGDKDAVKCYHCGKVIRDWEPQDDVWTEHAKWSPKCPFLLSNKGSAFVHSISQEQAQGTSGMSASSANMKTEMEVETNEPRNSYPFQTSQQQAESQSVSQREFVVPSQPSKQHHPELFYSTQVSTAQIENDLRNATVLAVANVEDLSVDQLIEMLKQIRLDKGPAHQITRDDLYSHMPSRDEDMTDGEGSSKSKLTQKQRSSNQLIN